MATSISADEIIIALSNDPRFSDPVDFDQVKEFLVQLPQILGEDRLAAQVTLKGFLEAETDFLRAILETDFDKDLGDLGVTRSVFNQLIDQLVEMANNVEDALASMWQSESDALCSPQLGLNDEAKHLYRAGALTFAEVVRINPGVFIPRT